MFRSYKLIFTRKLTAITLFLLINNLALAANIDFKAINAAKQCTDNHMEANCTNENGSGSACEHDKNKIASGNVEASKSEPCADVKIEQDYVEPRFSTKRPRGQ